MTVDVYELSCSDCSFASVVEGDVHEVFDEIDMHQADVDDGGKHFVNFAIKEQ